jgi:hypothetical protein
MGRRVVPVIGPSFTIYLIRKDSRETMTQTHWRG